jgi:large subunit ribosomal protein L4
MKAPVYDLLGKKLRDEDLPDEVFGIRPNVAVMHQAVVRQEANARFGLHKTKTRSDVNRTKAKWYRQKGTGRARHGSRAAPIFVGGGISHGPQPRKYIKRMPRKMRRLALRSAFAAKAAAADLALVEGLEMDAPKTRVVRDLVDTVSAGASTLFVLRTPNDNVQRSIRNLPNARYMGLGELNVREVLRHDKVLVEAAAIADLVTHLGRATEEASDA